MLVRHENERYSQLWVCEKSGAWAEALRREPGSESLRLRETRSWDSCLAQWEPGRAHLVCLEIRRDNLELRCRQMAAARSEWSPLAILVTAPRELQVWQWMFREAGAIHVAFSSRQLVPFVQIMRRWQACYPPLPESTFPWDTLPWQDAAASDPLPRSTT